MDNNTAKKFDGGKIRLDLLPFDSLMDVGEVLTFGASKYGDDNWRKGDSIFAKRCLGACFRHLFKHMNGIEIDDESSLKHLAHAATNILMAMHLLSKENKTN